MPFEFNGLDDIEVRGWVQWSDGTWGALGADGFVVDIGQPEAPAVDRFRSGG
ncbi:hypothetical protein [Nocardia cyriacigeorgica]|uniref:hypothetical protein n=1 Tax=Nocardia cyriacigeorgica TaxID=135487 RepID=UPI002455A070|nr:hypothetical protein [Nocardia cyriacigeorgica]